MSQLVSIITTVRHGKKDATGQLESEGKVQSAHRAVNIEHLEGDLTLFHSGEQRVQDTIKIIGGNIHTRSIEELEEYLEEKYELQDYIVPTLHFLKNKQVKSQFFSGWDGDTNEMKVGNFISLGEAFDEPVVAYTSLEMACNVARIIYTQMQFSLLTSEETKANFVNGTHEPVIVSFLYYALQDFNPTHPADEFIKNIGGSIQYTEGFDVKIYQHDHHFEKAILQFRDIEVDLTPEKILRFITTHEKNS